MNTLVQKRKSHNETCITVKGTRRTQRDEIYVSNEGCGLAFFGTDLEHIFVSNVGNNFGVLLRLKGPHKPETVYDIVRIHSLMINKDLIEYNIDGDMKVPLLRCIFFVSNLKNGDIITTGQSKNYQTLSNLQFRSLLKYKFQNKNIDLTDMSCEKIPYVYIGITRLVLLFRKASTFISNLKDVTRCLL